MSHDPCRFFNPGPSWVRPEILAEMARPVIGHRTTEFRETYSRILDDLGSLFATKQHAFVATSSGTGILEAAMINCVPRSVLVTTCGAFSERWLNIAERLGLEADRFSAEWGKAVDPVALADFVAGRHRKYDAITITHNETSTGVMNDLETLARTIRDVAPDSLILVDAVSSLACTPILFDEWGLDVCLASVQKGLALPPGITVFAVSERAMARAETKPYRGMYFDFLEFRQRAEKREALFTPSIPHVFALATQLDAILRHETLERRWERHREMRRLTHERLSGFADLAPSPAVASVSISALRPRSSNAPEVVGAMKARGFTIGGGYGRWKEDTFRIGHMGDVPVDDLLAMLDVLAEVLVS